MKPVIFLIFLFLLIEQLFAQPQIFKQPLSSRIANYDINVKLDADKRILTGTETLRWYNKTTEIIRELQFHLYLNAFRNHKSTYIKETNKSTRFKDMKPQNWGMIEVTKIKTTAGANIINSLEFISPDDNNIDDKTVFRLPLNEPLSPGDSVILYIDFMAKLPDPPIARSGAKGNYFFVAQWFPKVGVYIDGQWNCHQYHMLSEFFGEFGVYNVNITVPDNHIVGATGIEANKRNNGDGTITHFYHAEDVHDFAWTSSPNFKVFTSKAQDVDIRLLIQKEHENQAERHLESAAAAIEYCQNNYGDYPYPNLTIVDPQYGTFETGGMEYPTLITAGTFYNVPTGLKMPEMVTIHEFGHNYWYGIVASNEFEESWLDEGITTFSEGEIVQNHYGKNGNMIKCLDFKLNNIQYTRAIHIVSPFLDPILTKSWKFYSGDSYGVCSYFRAGIALTTLQNYIGKERMNNIFRSYYEQYKFQHPNTRNFISTAMQATGIQLDGYFFQALYTTNILDYSVDLIRAKEAYPDKGYDIDTSESKSDSDTKTYLNEVRVVKLGTFTFPVDIEVGFDNGEKIREKWDGVDSWKKYFYTKDTKITYATVDPEYKIPLDINYTNNSKTREPQTEGINKLATRILFWFQCLIDQPEMVNILTFFIGW